MPKFVLCDECGEKILKDKATYVQGRPYCENCVSEAESTLDADVFDEDDEDYYDDDED
jgi:RNA polymerase-binding transcription factor DksA